MTKWNIVNLSATVIFGVVSVVGLIYTLSPGTDPNISGAWVNVSADMITLGLLLLGAVALSIPLILVVRLLSPAVRQRLKSRRRRFAELATELRELQHMTVVRGVIPAAYSIPSPERRTRALLLVKELANLGIDCHTPAHSESPLATWHTLGNCFEVLAVLADAGKLDEANAWAKTFRV